MAGDKADEAQSVGRSVKSLVKGVLPKATRTWITARRQERFEKQLIRRHLRATDVFIVAHPKSGNTWLAYMLAILLCKDREGRVHMGNQGRYVPHMHHEDATIAEYDHLPDPRVFRNESPRYPELCPKIVYLVRDPRSVLVSLYDMYVTIFGQRFPLTFEAFVDEYLTHGCIRRWEPWQVRWDRQVLAWLRRADRDPRVMVVKYEDMVRDRRGVLERVARFAGIDYGVEDLEQAVARGSFEAMRHNEEEHGAEAYSPEEQRRGRFVRRGQPEGWKDEIEPRLLTRIEEAFLPAMRATGYR